MDIDRFLASHDGVVSRAQARACGLTDRQIARRVHRGEWLRRAPAIYFVAAWSLTMAARVRIAAEWCSPLGTVIGVTAAWWRGFETDSPLPITVALPPRMSRAAPPGITAVRRDLHGDRERHRGLWVTGPSLTVLDAAVALGGQGQAFLDRALQQHVSLDALRIAQSRHLGRRTSAAAGRLLARAGDRAASEAERRFLALLRTGGITGWVVNLECVLLSGREAIIDVAFPDVRLAIEVDGWASHEDRERFVGGRVRKRGLTASGWTVIEVTWNDLVERPDEVVAEIRRILLRLAAGPAAS